MTPGVRETPSIDFWFEFGSTYSYPATMRIESLAARRNIAVTWRPFLLGPIFREHGLADSPFNLNPSKGRYMWRDLERICAAHDIKFMRPSVFPRNGLLAARVACWHQEARWLPTFVRGVFSANFAEDRDIADPAVVGSCLAAAGVDPLPALEAARSDASKDRLRRQTENAVSIGIFGAPSMTVGQELFWGNDRLEAALSWAAGHSA